MERVQIEQPAVRRRRTTIAPILDISSQTAQLGNGRYHVLLSAAGCGVSECGGLDVSRWSADPTSDSDGFHVYLRDLDDEFVWSAGYQPTCVIPDAYEFRFTSTTAEISREDREIECRFAVCVAPEKDLEVRRCRLTNTGNRTRRIELTSYVEFVLASRDADMNHPAFSKLFIETKYWAPAHAIIARRRPRRADEPERFGFHRLLLNPGHDEHVQFETNRKLFIGRGRSLARPRALDLGARLDGDQGPVLDPVGSLRTVVSLAAGKTCDMVWLLGYAEGRDAIDDLVVSVDDLDGANQIMADAEDAHSSTNGDRVLWIGHAAHPDTESRLHGSKVVRNYLPASEVITESDLSAAPAEPLLCDNGYGGFTTDGKEYLIRLTIDAVGQLKFPPQPWVNVIANEVAGCIVTERGGGYTWSGNSRHNRLTAWYNDPVCDPLAEAFWIRDETADVFWSPLPGPTPAAGPYEVRHGFGYSVFRHNSLGLSQETTISMAVGDPVKLVCMRIENTGTTARKLTVFAFQRLSLGTLPCESQDTVTEYDESLDAILARNPRREIYGEAVTFSSVVMSGETGDVSYTGDRAAFVGKNRDLPAPFAVTTGEFLDGHTGGELDACAAWQIPIDIPPGQSFECAFLLGEAADRDSAVQLVRKYDSVRRVRHALDEVRAFWQNNLSAIQIETPDLAIDLMVNGWLTYQNLSCRMWGRSAYYQPGGAYGFRDQLQDVSALVYHRPDLTRQQILRHASRQFVEGDVLHWWHSDSGIGLRTRFSDDLLWLPLVTAAYVEVSGDEGVLDEVVPFVTGDALAPDQQELVLCGETTSETASVYEHCCRAMDRGLTTGSHGLPLMGGGDWNDGMNRVGREGRGESVWLGFFIIALLDRMLPICQRRGDHARIERYSAYRQRLVDALNSAGWDGAWYRRAYDDHGRPLGSAECQECQIDALVQAWAVLSDAAPRDRAESSLGAVEERLVVASAGLIRLLAPPFDRTPLDPGYIKGYLPGVRENGGQYTHGVLWYVRALAKMGYGGRATAMLRMLSPVAHSSTPSAVEIYQVEPYVVAADVYAEPPHIGRGGWTWYTGSAGWMFRTAVESILGFSIEAGQWLVINPAISASWPQCRLIYRVPGGKTCYEIVIENPDHREHGVKTAMLDGEPAMVIDGAAKLPLVDDDQTHRIVVRL